MSSIDTFECKSLQDTQRAGEIVASQLSFPSCVFIQGDMGAGKTTLCKSIINALGYPGSVTSPTYTLIQEYPVDQKIIYHMDLYRLNDPEELEYLALSDLYAANSIFLIEWPEKGGRYLPKNTHEIEICSDLHRRITFSKIE